jgi:hypothetical protein
VLAVFLPIPVSRRALLGHQRGRTHKASPLHHSHAFCLAGEKLIEDLRQFVFGNARVKSRDAQLHQTLLNKPVEVKVGYLANLVEYWGPYRAGNLSSRIFGPSGSIPIAASRLFSHRNSAAPGRRLKCLMVTLSLLKIRQ